MGYISFVGGTTRSLTLDVSDRSAIDTAQADGKSAQAARERLSQLLESARIGLGRGDHLAMIAIAIGFYQLVESYKRYLELVPPSTDPDIAGRAETDHVIGAADDDIGLAEAAPDESDGVENTEIPTTDAGEPTGSIATESTEPVELQTSGSGVAKFDGAAILGVAPTSVEFIFDSGSTTRMLLGGTGDDVLIGDAGDKFLETSLQTLREDTDVDWRPRVAQWPAIGETMAKIIQASLVGQTKPKQALDDAQQQVERIMAGR